ncbi:MAG: AAA family ATPase [Candidatus Heimdallarchaeota archaeon]|nr:AAA family ATPase [Candidatus Heimdallarchaeota archaeon]
MDINTIKELTSKIVLESRKRLVGYDENITLILASLYSNGHILLEGNPGIAKTFASKTLADILGMEFGRVQFTPDLMPSDITGVNVFNQKTLEFEYLQGPVFTNFLLCDEINRAPPKTQAALLEAMQERQISVEGDSKVLPDPFLVIATQNPLEHQGVYNLPEAQIDRFLIRLIIDLPDKQTEFELLRLKDKYRDRDVDTLCNTKIIKEIQEKILEVEISEEVTKYIIDIVHATRDNSNIEVPASPRASLALMNLGKSISAMKGRDYVQPDDVKSIAFHVLNHRIGLSHEAELDRITPKEVIDNLLKDVEVTI